MGREAEGEERETLALQAPATLLFLQWRERQKKL